MDIKGLRRCTECGNEWSYFQTREVRCTECGSYKSKPLQNAETHTASNLGLEFHDLYSSLNDDLESSLQEIEKRARSFISRQGFINQGDLRPPEPRYVMARELMEISTAASTGELNLDSTPERRYVIDLIRGIEASNPPTDRPDSIDPYHNSAVAKTAQDYSHDLYKYLKQNGIDPPGEIEKSRSLSKRTLATQGRENDAKKGLRLLRDVYSDLSEKDDRA